MYRSIKIIFFLASSCSTSCMWDFELDLQGYFEFLPKKAHQHINCVPLENDIWHAHEHTISHCVHTTDPTPSPWTWCQMRLPHTGWAMAVAWMWLCPHSKVTAGQPDLTTGSFSKGAQWMFVLWLISFGSCASAHMQITRTRRHKWTVANTSRYTVLNT